MTLDVDGPSKPVNDGRGHLHLGVSATGTLDRTDFGMTAYQGIAGTLSRFVLRNKSRRRSYCCALPQLPLG